MDIETALCLYVLGLEKAGKRQGTPCSGIHTGRCRGACIGREPLRTHQARLSAILAKVKLKPWPFAGHIAIHEQDEASIARDWHLFEHWAYLGTVSREADLATLMASSAQVGFDVDIYRILNRTLVSKHNLHIVPLASATPQSDEAEGQ